MANSRVVGVTQSKKVLKINSLPPEHLYSFLHLWHR